VTEEPCKCSYLERAAEDPDSPIVFDHDLHEYDFEYPSPCGDGACKGAKAKLRIYHCPFCGGTAPESKRPLLFSVIPGDEERRLFALLGSFKTVEEATQALGPPDEEIPYGLTMKQPEQDGNAPNIESFRTLRYSSLSETAVVNISDSRDGRIHVWLHGKYIGQSVAGR
jgi:hypothetical protein